MHRDTCSGGIALKGTKRIGRKIRVMKPLIIFDMDGTLYDLGDVMDSVYETQVSFLQNSKGWSRSRVTQFMSENGVEPHVTKNSKSATELFIRLGFGRKEWTEYRQARFPIAMIDPGKAAPASLLERYAHLGDMVLLTSNTIRVCEGILARIGLDGNPFRRIVCSDSPEVGEPFNKFQEMKRLMGGEGTESVLSIGDRYQTDIVPALKLGGCGCLVKGPSSLEKVYVDLEHGRLGSCSEYEYFTT